MAEEEEVVNPQIELEEACKPQCIKALLAYQACDFCLILILLFICSHTFLTDSSSVIYLALHLMFSLQACEERIKGDKTGEAHCIGQVRRCLRHCHSLFSLSIFYLL